LRPICIMLPPGELNRMIVDLLLICPVGFMTIVVTVLPAMLQWNKHRNKQTNIQTKEKENDISLI